MQTDPNDTQELSAEIVALLDAPTDGDGSPSLSELEDTLTTGYARALALEAERTRIERGLADTTGHDLAEQQSRLTEVERSLADLRRLLAPLRSRARTARTLQIS
jgi:Mg2+ and Co2+ transporter CorA